MTPACASVPTLCCGVCLSGRDNGFEGKCVREGRGQPGRAAAGRGTSEEGQGQGRQLPPGVKQEETDYSDCWVLGLRSHRSRNM